MGICVPLALPMALEKQMYSALGMPNETRVKHKGRRKRITVNKETLV